MRRPGQFLKIRARGSTAIDMYRFIITFVLFIGVASPAPQDSNVTFVKIEPLVGAGSPQNTTFRESRVEKLPLVIPSNITLENNDPVRHVRSDDITTELDQSETTTDLPEIVTENIIQKLPQISSTAISRPSPRFISKLSYFNKANYLSDISTNVVERTGKRKYKSKCRCEKIWNCPKLQITVPRCPDEYFLCCF